MVEEVLAQVGRSGGRRRRIAARRVGRGRVRGQAVRLAERVGRVHALREVEVDREGVLGLGGDQLEERPVAAGEPRAEQARERALLRPRLQRLEMELLRVDLEAGRERAELLDAEHAHALQRPGARREVGADQPAGVEPDLEPAAARRERRLERGRGGERVLGLAAQRRERVAEVRLLAEGAGRAVDQQDRAGGRDAEVAVEVAVRPLLRDDERHLDVALGLALQHVLAVLSRLVEDLLRALAQLGDVVGRFEPGGEAEVGARLRAHVAEHPEARAPRHPRDGLDEVEARLLLRALAQVVEELRERRAHRLVGGVGHQAAPRRRRPVGAQLLDAVDPREQEAVRRQERLDRHVRRGGRLRRRVLRGRGEERGRGEDDAEHGRTRTAGHSNHSCG